MRTLFALAALGFAAACTHPVDRANAPAFGAAVEMNRNAQEVSAGAAGQQPPEGSGAVGTLAQTRYKTGQTRPLLPTSSSIANPSSR
jgi:hypothetical protein